MAQFLIMQSVAKMKRLAHGRTADEISLQRLSSKRWLLSSK
jgi:hypothetical protein